MFGILLEHTEDHCCDSTMKEHFQPACQSITLIDSPVCLSDSGRHYFISADVLPLLRLHCGANSVHFLVQNKMPLSCIFLTCSIDTAQSASLCLWRRRVLWHRGANMKNSLQTLAVLLPRHHRKRLVIRCTSAAQRVMFCIKALHVCGMCALTACHLNRFIFKVF